MAFTRPVSGWDYLFTSAATVPEDGFYDFTDADLGWKDYDAGVSYTEYLYTTVNNVSVPGGLNPVKKGNVIRLNCFF